MPSEVCNGIVTIMFNDRPEQIRCFRRLPCNRASKHLKCGEPVGRKPLLMTKRNWERSAEFCVLDLGHRGKHDCGLEHGI